MRLSTTQRLMDTTETANRFATQWATLTETTQSFAKQWTSYLIIAWAQLEHFLKTLKNHWENECF